MRIISGRYKGAAIYSVPGQSTRPTSSFHREMIFSMVEDYEGKKVLDLFAGTGSLGLEALSRGSTWVDFVEFATPAISTLIKNIQKLKCGELCHVHRRKVQTFLTKTSIKYELIFIDPPYNKGLLNPCLLSIFENDLLADGGIIVAEHDVKEKIDELLEQNIIKKKEGKLTEVTLLGASHILELKPSP